MPEAVRLVLVPGMWNGVRLWQILLDMASKAPADMQMLELAPMFTPRARPVWGFAHEVAAFEQQLAQQDDGRPVVLVAHSYGAQHALAMSRRKQVHVAGLVLLAPALGRGWWLHAGRRMLHGLLAGRSLRALYFGPQDDAWRLARLAKASARWPRAINPMAMLAQVVSALWQGVTLRALDLPRHAEVPVLVVWSEADGILPAGQVKPQMHVTEWRLPGEGHFLFMGEADLWQRIEQWVGTVIQAQQPSPRQQAA